MALLGALAVLTAATVGLVLLVEPVLTAYYHLAWWSYIVAVDALNRRLAGRSLLRDEPGRFLLLALGSVAWWTLFEALNLRLGNWYYVMDPAARALRWTAGVLAFATVLPGIVETVTLLENLGWLRSLRTAPLAFSPLKEKATVGLGAACFFLPLAWPDLFFPLTWGSFVFLLEPWNRRHAARSFLRDLEEGEAGPFVRTLVAGLICGVLWEAWNHGARMKWIYTVPGFERLKVFEMPLLGFLGFPPFAVECVVVLRFASTLWGRAPGWSRAVVAAVLLAFTGVVFDASDRVTVDSFHVPVGRLAVLPRDARERLARLGLDGPEKLLRALGTGEGRAAWSDRSLLEPSTLERVHSRVALVMHRGLGEERALQLARLRIESLEDLSRWETVALTAALRAQRTDPRDRFLERRVRVWLDDGRLGARREPGEARHEQRLDQVQAHVEAVQGAEAPADVGGQRAGREVVRDAEVPDGGTQAQRLRGHGHERGQRQPAWRAPEGPEEGRHYDGQRELRGGAPAEHPAVHLRGEVPQHRPAVRLAQGGQAGGQLRAGPLEHPVHGAERGGCHGPGRDQQPEP